MIFRSTPKLAVYAPRRLVANSDAEIAVELVADRVTRVTSVDAWVLGTQGWSLGEGDTPASRLVGPRIAVRLLHEATLPVGPTRLPLRFRLPDMPPTHHVAPAVSELLVTVRVAMPWWSERPWWPDGKRMFQLRVQARAPALIPRTPGAFRSATTTDSAPRIELGIASTALVAGELVRGSFAIYHVDDRKPCDVEIAFQPVLRLHGRFHRRTVVATGYTATVVLPAGAAGRAVPFAVRLPASATPSFRAATHDLEWMVVVSLARGRVGQRLELAVPVVIHDAAAASVAARLAPPPRLGDERVTQVFDRFAKTARGWRVVDDASERSGSAGPRSAAEGRRGESFERSGSAGPRSAAEGRRGESFERSGSAGPRSAAEGRRGESFERSGSAGPRSAAEGRRGDVERSGSAGPRSAAEGQRGESFERSGSAGPRSAAEGQRGESIERVDGDSRMRMTYEYRGRAGTFLRTSIEHAPLGLGLRTARTRKRGAADIAPRSAAQGEAFVRDVTAVARRLAGALGPVVSWHDDAIVFERAIETLESATLDDASDALVRVDVAIRAARAAIAPPPDLAVDLAAWRALAARLHGAVTPGDLAITGDLDGVAVRASLAFDDRGTPDALIASAGSPDRAPEAVRAVALDAQEPAAYGRSLQAREREGELAHDAAYAAAGRQLATWPEAIANLVLLDGVASARRPIAGRAEASEARELVELLCALLAALAPGSGPYR